MGFPPRLRWFLLLLTLLGGPARPAAQLTVDVDTLNELLPAVLPSEIQVRIAGSLRRIELRDFRIEALDPSHGEDSRGRILTSLKIRVPDFGLELPVRPGLVIGVVDRDRSPSVEIRFQQATVDLPVAGEIDLARLIPPVRYPAESFFSFQGTAGEVPMAGRLTEVRMGRTHLRFEFEVRREEP